MTEKPTLENLPMHALRAKAKEIGITIKNTDKKKDIINFIIDGKRKEFVKPAKVLENKKIDTKVIPLLPKAVQEKADKMGVRYEVDEDACCVTFFGSISVCANLDQSELNIMNSLNATKPKASPVEVDNLKGSFV